MIRAAVKRDPSRRSNLLQVYGAMSDNTGKTSQYIATKRTAMSSESGEERRRGAGALPVIQRTGEATRMVLVVDKGTSVPRLTLRTVSITYTTTVGKVEASDSVIMLPDADQIIPNQTTFELGMGCEITTCSFVTTAPLTSHSQPVPDRRKELFLFVTVETASLQYCTVDGSTKQLRIRSVYQRLALLLVSLSQAALEQVQSNLAPRLCDRLRCNRSGATLFLYVPEIFWSSRTVEWKWIRCVLVIELRSGGHETSTFIKISKELRESENDN
uniref:Uncharacterized protein n=1 Tax=Timema tahoe TaxID=61484 RepID=A0A7R9NY75_9NEOP|nr:unnamed protein product [Timema tahoe]